MTKLLGALRGVFLVVMAVGLAACATRNIANDYALSDGANKGVVVGSITYSGAYAGYEVHYRKVDDAAVRGFFHYGMNKYLAMPRTGKSDIAEPGNPGVRGDLFAAELPAGEYEISSWEVSQGTTATSTPTQPVSIRFTVKPGEATYLGNYHFVRTSRALTLSTGYEVTAKDEAARDLKIFAEKYPRLSQAKVTSGIGQGQRYEQIGGRSHTVITFVIYN
jgi:hypothetical protein